jgi:radical SAM protein (TIGR04043 family)
MSNVAILHGKDCLASTVYSKCIYWSNTKQCKFCGIELARSDRLVRKQPKQLGEVAEEAFKEGVAKHVTLTTGTPPGLDKGALMLAEVAKAIKERVNLPLHVQLEPLENSKYLEELCQAGVDTVGIHIESFDKKVLSYVCPVKSKVEDYFEAWKNAVEVFGEGQVSTFIIAGMGETDESIMLGSEKAARLGVIPYLLPLRPIPGTFFEKVSPPTPRRMIKLYQSITETLHRVGLDPRKNKAGCVRCGACSAIQEAFVFPL